MPSLYMLWLLAWYSWSTPHSGVGVSVTPLQALGTVILLLPCLAQPQYEGFRLVLLSVPF